MILQRIVIRQQQERRVAVQVMAPMPARVDQREELLLSRVVVQLGRRQLARHVGDGLQPVAVILLQRRADRIVTRVAVQCERQRRVGDQQHRRARQCRLQLIECRLLPIGPGERRAGLRLRQFGEGQRDVAEPSHEPTIEAGEAEERSDVADVAWHRPLAHRRDLVLHDRQSIGADVMAEEFDLAPRELALAQLRVQLRRSQPIQHLAQVHQMLLDGGAEHQYVVEEDEHAPIQQIAERVVHQLHERTRRVAESHRQHPILEAAVASTECRLLDVVLVNSDLVESGSQVQLREDLRVDDAIEQFIHQWQWVFVLHRQVVQRAIVDDYARCAVLLADDQRHRAVRRRADPQLPRRDHRTSVLLEHGEVLRRLVMQRSRRRWCRARLQLNAMLHAAHRRQSRRQRVGEHVSELRQQRRDGRTHRLGRRRCQ